MQSRRDHGVCLEGSLDVILKALMGVVLAASLGVLDGIIGYGLDSNIG